MIVVLYSKDAGVTWKVATAYIGRTLDQVKADGWAQSRNHIRYHEVSDDCREQVDAQTWRVSISAEKVIADGAELEVQEPA